MKKAFLILVFVSLVFSFAAQAEVVETTRWRATPPPEGGFYVVVNTSGISAANFHEATQMAYASASNDDAGDRDYAEVRLSGDVLELLTPARIKATFTYNVPVGGIAGQADAAMYIIQAAITDRPGATPAGVELTETVAPGEFPDIKHIKLIESSRDQTNSIASKNVMPAGRYYAVFEFRVPGYTGRPELPTADALNRAKMVRIRLETVAPASKIRK